MSGNIIAPEDVSEKDGLLDRANAFRTRGPAALSEYGVDPRVLAEVRPSAEEMIIDIEDTEHGKVVIWTLQGNARVIYEDIILSADTIRLRLVLYKKAGQEAPEPDEEEEEFESVELESIYAEGGVELSRGADRIVSDAMILDVRVEEGFALSARLRTTGSKAEVPIQFYADAIRQLSRNRFIVEGPGYFTTSRLAVPHYRIEGRAIRLVRGPGLHRWREIREVRKEEGADSEEQQATEPEAPESLVVTSQHNLFYLGPIPIFYWPYLVKDVQTGAFLLTSAEAGTSSNMGTYGKLEWNLYDLGIFFNDWSELALRTDYFSERGFGMGLDFSYEGASRYGFARGYHINDTATTDDRGLPTPQNHRGEVTIRHREMPGFLPENWRLDMELGYLSDRRFLRTYERDEFDEAKDRETGFFLSHISHNREFNARYTDRVNDFQNTVERQSVAYHMIGQPLFDSPFLFTTHADFSNLRLQMDDALGTKNANHVARLDLPAEMSLPVQLGPVRADPFVWGDVTTYSNRTRSGSGARWASAFGTRAATNFYRTYQAQNETLGVDRLRHIVTPTAEYLNRWSVSKAPGTFIQHDEIDALDESHRASAGLHNRLQTYRPAGGEMRSVDFMYLDTDYVFRLSNSGSDRGVANYVEVSAGWAITENIEIVSEDNLYNTSKTRLDALNSELRLNYWQPLGVTLGHKYYVDSSDPSLATHSIGTAGASYQPRFSRWRVDFNTAYDFQARRRAGDTKDPAKLGSALSLTRNLEGWEVSVGAKFNQGRANETILTLNIALPDFGNSSQERWGGAR